jgi:hypothetical protein
LNNNIEPLAKAWGILMMITSQHEHPDFFLPVAVSDFWPPVPPLLKSDLASPLCQISSSLDVDTFRLFVDAVNGVLLVSTDAKLADLSGLAINFGFVRVLSQIEARDPGSRSLGRRPGEDVRQLTANLHDAIPPARNELIMMNLTCSLRELTGDRSAEVHQTSRSLIGHQRPMGKRDGGRRRNE